MNRLRKIEFQTNEAQDERNRTEFKTPEGTRREGPPFPIDPLTKFQESMAQILERGGGAERLGERGGARLKGEAVLFWQGAKEREERVRGI